RFGSPDAYSPVPLYEIFLPKTWHANYADGAFFQGKVVIVGVSAQVMHDFVDTPVDANMHGPKLHLHALAAALDHEFIRETPLRAGFVFILTSGLSAWLLIAFLRRPLLCIFVLAAVTGG